MKWFLLVLKKYADFSGRAQRAEYWYFTLFCFLISIALTIVDNAMGLYSTDARIGVFEGLFILAVFIPSLAVTIRRLHDTNRSAWWFLIAFIPVVGTIVLIIFFVQPGTLGENKYGPNPKLAAT